MDKQLPGLNEDTAVKEYLKLLLNNSFKKEYNETKELIEYIVKMEQQ